MALPVPVVAYAMLCPLPLKVMLFAFISKHVPSVLVMLWFSWYSMSGESRSWHVLMLTGLKAILKVAVLLVVPLLLLA